MRRRSRGADNEVDSRLASWLALVNKEEPGLEDRRDDEKIWGKADQIIGLPREYKIH
jgi:hypothetical protein